MRCSSLVATVIAAAACLPLGAQQGRDDSFSWSKQLSAGATLTIKNINGPITVAAATGDRVTVHAVKVSGNQSADPANYTFDVQDHGGDVSICTVYRGESACSDSQNFKDVHMSVHYTVEIPSTINLRLTTGNGALDITQAGASVVATTGNGHIVIGATTGQVTATSGNGDVSIEGAKGVVRVTTGNGRISVKTTEGPVTARTGNGNIDVAMTAIHGDGAMDFSSGSGAIRVTVPATFAGQIDATTGNGSLTSDFEITMSGRLDTHHVHGSIGGGSGPVIKMVTGNGRIELKKG
jgi:DUF4097 and DUF4098 domain-containing protein YvlB